MWIFVCFLGVKVTVHYDANRLDLRWPVKASEKKQELKSEIHFNLNATKFLMKSY